MSWFTVLTTPRVAARTGVWVNALKTGLQIAAFWTVFYLILPQGVLWLEDRLGWLRGSRLEPLAVPVFALGGALALSCAYQLVRYGAGTPLPVDAPRQFVVRGAYRWVRNPMALGSFAQGFAVASWHGSAGVALYVCAGCLIWNCVARPWEERDLEARFGAAFLEYKAAVRCWIPRLQPFTPQSNAAVPTS